VSIAIEAATGQPFLTFMREQIFDRGAKAHKEQKLRARGPDNAACARSSGQEKDRLSQALSSRETYPGSGRIQL
jgi:hypothetical protein